MRLMLFLKVEELCVCLRSSSNACQCFALQIHLIATIFKPAVTSIYSKRNWASFQFLVAFFPSQVQLPMPKFRLRRREGDYLHHIIPHRKALLFLKIKKAQNSISDRFLHYILHSFLRSCVITIGHYTQVIKNWPCNPSQPVRNHIFTSRLFCHLPQVGGWVNGSGAGPTWGEGSCWLWRDAQNIFEEIILDSSILRCSPGGSRTARVGIPLPLVLFKFHKYLVFEDFQNAAILHPT